MTQGVLEIGCPEMYHLKCTTIKTHIQAFTTIYRIAYRETSFQSNSKVCWSTTSLSEGITSYYFIHYTVYIKICASMKESVKKMVLGEGRKQIF